MCYSVSQSQSNVDVSGTSHVKYLVIKTYKLAERTVCYTPKPHTGRVSTVAREVRNSVTNVLLIGRSVNL